MQDTQPSQQPPVASPAGAGSIAYMWEVAGMSHRGKVRSNNEDHFLIARFGRFLETVHTNLPPLDLPLRSQDSGYAFVVADGLGGHAAGEVASRSAITILWDLVLKTPDWILRLEDEAYVAEVLRRAKERCAEIDAALAAKGEQEPRLAGMATTLTVAATTGNTVIVSHVGDSRAYLLRQGRLYQLTRDHTCVQELIDQKVISQSDAAAHRFRHVLTNALGMASEHAAPDAKRLTLRDGDCLLLCTDGLSSYVDEMLILGIVDSGDTPERICQRLIDEALQAGGKDNVTVAFGRGRQY